MQQKIIVVENFYTQPDLVRNMALQDQYASVAKFNYPGYQSHKIFSSNAIKTSFEKILGKEIEVDNDRVTFGGFRMITEETGAMPKVHTDAIDWAGMVFLSPDAPADKGVGFYRHKETGLEGPPTDREARALGFEDASEFDRQVSQKDQADLSKWELISFVSPVYNRLVLFRGRELYHAPIGGFGENPVNCRLTHNFFFQESR